MKQGFKFQMKQGTYVLTTKEIAHGVPQGLILGPIIFLLYEVNSVIKELQTWFALNSFVVNVEKTAVSFHTMQSKKPGLPHIIPEGRDIPYTTVTKFQGIHVNENMKWNNHIRYLSQS
jgi:hypothetical protein